jgi:uncharacterized membrane protein
MSLLGAFHLATAFAAILSGASVLLTGPKGGRTHRRLGWVYLISMLALNASALSIYRLFGGFGPFHVASIVSIVSTGFGAAFAVRARRARVRGDQETRARLVEAHYQSISWSYIGLIAALVSETATRLDVIRSAAGPGPAFGLAVGLGTGVVVLVGSQLLRSRRERALAPFRTGR